MKNTPYTLSENGIRYSFRAAAVIAALLVLAGLPCTADVPVPTPAPPVPSGYCTSVYSELSTDLQNFNVTLQTPPSWAPVTFGPTIWGAALEWADSNTGPALSSATYFPMVQAELQMFKAMGIQAVTIPATFPILYEPFYGSQSAYTPYLNFYIQVVQAARALGFTVIVDNEFAFSNDIAAGWSNTGAFYSSLTWQQYMDARAAEAATIAQQLQPDYLVLANEPDIEALQTGQQNLNDPAQAAQMVAEEIAAVQALGLANPPKLGAGFGTWLATNASPGLLDYINAYVALPLDYIDFHLLNVTTVNGNNFLQNALTIASMAAAAGKPVAIGQGWLNKSSSGEWDVLSFDDIRARGTFSFWDPLDIYYLQTLQTLANYTQMAYISAEWPNYFSARQTYGGTDTNGGGANCTCTTASCSDAAIMNAEDLAAETADSQAQFTTIGMAYYNMMVPTPDTTPPTQPPAPTPTVATTQVSLTWAPSTDDIGVAGYDVYRCTPPAQGQPCAGVWIANTTLPTFADPALTGNTFYTYQIQAFDMANNLSLPSPSITVQTYRTSADPPTGLVATAISAQEIDLSWSPPSDQTGLEVYLVFGGTNPANLTQITTRANGQTTFKDMGLSPSTTYYFAVLATEDGINSALTSIASATTLPLPNAPTGFTGTTTASSITINWQETAVPNGLPITFYQVYEGTSCNSLTQVGTNTATMYMVNSLNSSTTYYFEVVASDSQHDYSLPSACVSFTTAATGATPANVTPVANSATQVTVTWTENLPQGALPILAYTIYRGTSPTLLTQLAQRATTQFIDTAASPNTTYYYGVTATDTSHTVSPMSPAVSVTTPAMPAVPGNVTATGTSAVQVTVAWIENVPSNGLPVSSYAIYRGSSPSGLTKLTSRTASPFIDNAVTANTIYYYAVQAVDSGKDVSPESAAVQVTTPPMPAAPVNVTAVATGTTQVTVSWTENIPPGGLPITSYSISRGTSATNLTKLTSRTASPFIDTGVAANTTYYYSIQAFDSSKDLSPSSSVAVANPLSGPAAPVITSATPLSATQITVNWTETMPPGGLPISGYTIFRGASAGNLVKVTTRTGTTFTDSGLSPNTTYYYGIQATDTGHDVSPMSTAYQTATVPLPAAPVNLAPNPISAVQVTVTWMENIPANGMPVTTYTIYRGTSPGSMVQVAQRAGTTYIDTTTSGSTTYYYSVTAIDSGHDVSAASAAAQVTTPAPPAAPNNVAASPGAGSTVYVSWLENIPQNGLPVSYYAVYRGTSPTNLTKLTTRTGLTYADTAVSSGTTYYYSIQAIDSGKATSPMSQCAQTTMP